MAKDRCINIDWLEVYALEDVSLYPCDANYFRTQGYQVNEREYGTKVWAEMFTILDWHDEPIIEVRRNPKSQIGKDGGLFPPNGVHLRLSNRSCYADNPINLLRNFMVKHCYELIRIYRIDIALDFEKFDRGDDPQAFIERYMNGKYSKVNQTRIHAHGEDMWNGRVWNSLSWGKPSSMVSTKLYCKTLELEEVNDKPYIKWRWFEHHLIDDPISMTKKDDAGNIYKPAIWRVEFAIRSEAKIWKKRARKGGQDEDISLPNSLLMYDSQNKLIIAFASLAAHYFHFKYFEYKQTNSRGIIARASDAVSIDYSNTLSRKRVQTREPQRKDRCKDKVLFDFSPKDSCYKIDRLASHTANNKPALRLIELLNQYSAKHPQQDVVRVIAQLVELIRRESLRDMHEMGITYEDLKAMQILISRRMEGESSKDPMKQLQEIKKEIKTLFDTF